MQKNRRRNLIKKLKKVLFNHKKPLLFLLTTWGLFFLVIWLNVLKVNSQGIYAGSRYLWGDWALHLGIASVFEFRSPENWFKQHPVYLNTPLNYTFASDAISGLLSRLGLPVELSFILPSIIFTFLLIVGMYFFFYQLIKNKKLAVVGVFLFMFSAGFGFLDFFREFPLALQEGSISAAINKTIFQHEFYSRIVDFEWYSSNTVTSLLLPQRSFLMGMSIALWVVNVIIWTLKYKMKKNAAVMLGVVLGLCSGILMITHIHSLIALIFICIGLVIFIGRRKLNKQFWISFTITAGLISSLLYFQFIKGTIDTTKFFRLAPFWTFGNLLQWIKMWFWVWGPPWIAGLYGAYRLIKKHLYKKYSKATNTRITASTSTAPTTVAKYKALIAVCFGLSILFIISNLIIFQPFAYDNSKLFFWSFLALIALSLYGIKEFFGLKKKYPSYTKLIQLIISIFIITSCLTGVLDILKMTNQVFSNKIPLMNSKDTEIADYFMNNTSEGIICLTSQKPNHPVFMRTHCQVLAAYEGWIYSYGIDYHQRLSDIRNMYANPEENLDLFEKYKVDYVVIEKNGFESYSGYVNAHYFETNSDKFSLIFQNESYRIFSANF